VSPRYCWHPHEFEHALCGKEKVSCCFSVKYFKSLVSPFRIRVQINESLLQKHLDKQKARPYSRVALDDESLRWTPVVSSAMLDEEERKAEVSVRPLDFESECQRVCIVKVECNDLIRCYTFFFFYPFLTLAISSVILWPLRCTLLIRQCYN
jgi:hypothetical protein